MGFDYIITLRWDISIVDGQALTQSGGIIPSVPEIFTFVDVNNYFKVDQTSNFSNEKLTNEKQSKRAWQIVGKILLTILALSFILFLEFIVLVLACNLSCNGNEAFAVLVGIGGTLLCLFLAFFLMKLGSSPSANCLRAVSRFSRAWARDTSGY